MHRFFSALALASALATASRADDRELIAAPKSSPCAATASAQRIVVQVPAPQITIQQAQGVCASSTATAHQPHQPLFGRKATYAPAVAYAYVPMATYAPQAAYVQPAYVAPQAAYVAPQPTFTLSLVAPQAQALALTPCPTTDARVKRLEDNMQTASELLKTQSLVLQKHAAAIDQHEQRLNGMQKDLEATKLLLKK